MGAKGQTIRVPRESRAGALHLVTNAPGRIDPQSLLAPVVLYFETISEGSRRVQRAALVRAARVLTGDALGSLDSFDWRGIRSSHVEFLRGALRGKLSSSSVNATLSAVRGVARWTWHLGHVDEREYLRIREVSCLRAERRVRGARALSPEEIVALFSSCEREPKVTGIRDACLMALLYAAGLRSREAVSLQLSDYVARSHTLYVNGKGGRERRAFFDDGGARRSLNAWLRLRGSAPGPLLHPVTKSGEIERSRPLSQRGLYRALERRAERALVRHFAPHDLRRSFGTHLDEEGESLDMIRELLGHVDVATTARYIIRGERRKRQATLKVGVPFRGRKKRRKHKRRRH